MNLKKKKKAVKKNNLTLRTASTNVPIQLLVDYQSQGTYLFDFCRNLGEAGIFIGTEEPRDQGSILELTFTIPDSSETIKTMGRVIWVQLPVKGRSDLLPGMGIQFEGLEAKTRKTLEEYVKRYRSPTAKLSNPLLSKRSE